MDESYTKEGRDADKDRRPVNKILSPIKSIRRHCIECMGGSTYEPTHCTDPQCWLWPYREGHNPRLIGKERTPAQKRATDRLRNEKKAQELGD